MRDSVTLVGATWQHQRGYRPLYATAAAYSQVRPGVRIAWESFEWDELLEVQRKELLANSGKYDLLMIDHPWLGEYVSKDWLIPVHDVFDAPTVREIQDDTPTKVLESYLFNGRLWALPFDASTQVFYYRRDVLENIGQQVPQDFDALQEIAQLIHNPPSMYGIGLPLRSFHAFDVFLSVFTAFGGQLFDEEGRWLYSSEPGEQALLTLSSMLKFSHPRSLAWGPWQSGNAIENGGTICFAPINYGYISFRSDCRQSSQVGVTMVPKVRETQKRSSVLGGVGLAVAKATAHPKECADYCKFSMDRSVIEKFIATSCWQPGRKSILTNNRWDEFSGGFFGTLMHSIEFSYLRPRFDGWQTVEVECGEVISRFLRGEISSRQVLKAMDEVGERLTNGAKREVIS